MAGVARQRRSWHRRRQVRIKFLVLLLFAATAMITWRFARPQTVSSLSYPPSEAVQTTLSEGQRGYFMLAGLSGSGSPAWRGDRLVYPYSVIRGGVTTPEELKWAMEHDPVVARHFQGFDYQHAHVVRVAEKQALYVSYRIGDRVYWTRAKVSLRPGETLITDGKIVARARCGNRVSPAPLDAGSPLEPPASELEQPAPEVAAMRSVPAAAALPASDPGAVPAATAHAIGSKAFIPLFAAPLAALPGGSSHAPLAVAPEPGTLLLISSGIAGVYWKSRKARRKQ